MSSSTTANVWEWEAWNYDLANRSLDRRGSRKSQGKRWSDLSYTDLENLGTPEAKAQMKKVDDELDNHFPELKLVKKWFPLSEVDQQKDSGHFVSKPGQQAHLAMNILRNAYLMHGNVPDLSFESTGIKNLEAYADILSSHQKAAKSFRGNKQQMRDEFHRQVKLRGHDSTQWVDSIEGAAIIRLPNNEHIISVHGTTGWLNPDGTLTRDAVDNVRNTLTNVLNQDLSSHTLSNKANKLIARYGVKTAVSYSKGSYEASRMSVEHHISYDGHLPVTKPTPKRTTIVGTTRSVLQNLRPMRQFIDKVITVNPRPTTAKGFGYVKDAHDLRHFGGTVHLDPTNQLANLSQIAGEATMMQSMNEALGDGLSFSEWGQRFGGYTPRVENNPYKDGLGYERVSFNSRELDLWEQLGGSLSKNELKLQNRGRPNVSTTRDTPGLIKAPKIPLRANPHLVKQFKNASIAEGSKISDRYLKLYQDYSEFVFNNEARVGASARLNGRRIEGAHMKYGTKLNTLIQLHAGALGQIGLDSTVGQFLRDHGVPEPVVQGLENGATTSGVTKWLEKARGVKLPGGGALRAGLTGGVGAVVGAAIADPLYSSLLNADVDPLAASTVTGAVVGASGSVATIAADKLATIGSNVLKGTRTASVAAAVGEGAMGAVRGVRVGMALAEGAMNMLGGAALLAAQSLVEAWTSQKTEEADILMGELYEQHARTRQLNQYLNRWGEEMVREGLRSFDWLEDLKQNPVFNARQDAQGSFFDYGFGHGHTHMVKSGFAGAKALAARAFIDDVEPAIQNLDQLYAEQYSHTTEQIFTPFSGMHSIRDIREHPALFNSEAGQSWLTNHWATYYADRVNPVLYENYIRTQIQNSYIDSLGETDSSENHLTASAIATAEMSMLPHNENHPYNLLPGQHTDGMFDHPATP